MTVSRGDLQDRRVDAVQAWTQFVERGDAPTGGARDPEVLGALGYGRGLDVGEAPLADESDTAAYWHGSPLQIGVERVESELRRTAEDGDLVLAVTDAETRILWTYGGRVMRRKAETVNFVAGGRWDDTSVGTNALDLATRNDAPAMVFSAEHYAPIVHNWVCWAAPVHDPHTGEQLGVIDLSTTWDRTHPIGLATARVMARLIETAMPASDAPAVAAGPRRGQPQRGPRRAHARHRRDHPRRTPAAAEPAADRDRRAARPQPRRALARAAPRAAVRRPGGHRLHAQGRGLPPAQRARGPAGLAALPADDAGAGRRRGGAPAAAQRPGARGGRGLRRRPAAGHRVTGPGRAGGVRRRRGARVPAGRPAAAGRGPLHRAGAVRHRGDRGLPRGDGRRTPSRRRPSSRGDWPPLDGDFRPAGQWTRPGRSRARH